ncbi:MAG: AzlC family ABC transporter permease, partial [Kiritimatiellae bacterium]|nr:AzlC family ABC transporter permease [Kiritimatiellia bacterium]
AGAAAGAAAGTAQSAAAAAVAVALLCIGLNLRYALLSFALAQKLPPGVGTLKRLVLAFVVTDENVALAVSRPFAPTPPYLAGVFASSYLGWNAGGALGALGSSLLPASALAPLGIAIYAMLVAIIVPEAKKSRPVLCCVLGAAAANAAISALPAGIRPAPMLSMLACGVGAAALSAWLAPAAPGKNAAQPAPENKEAQP